MLCIHLCASACALTSVAFAAGTGDEKDTFGEESYLPLSAILADEVTVKVGGRVFDDWGWFDGDDSFTTEDGTEFRAARVFIEGLIYDTVSYKAEYDFTGAPDFKDVYVALKDTFVGEVRVGHFKEPFSLEELTSSRFITFMERGLPSAFVPARSKGFQVQDHNAAKTMTWALGIFRNTSDGDLGLDTGDGEYAVTARVTGSLWNENEGASLLHLGVAASSRDDDDGMARFRSRPEAHLVNQVADTGAIADVEGTMLYGVEAAWVAGRISLQGEAIMASVEAEAEDSDFGGWYVLASYFLTGEHRTYKSSNGSFDRVKPTENFGLGGGMGAWELAARVSGLDLDDGASSDQLHDVTAGVNWYLNPNVRVMWNYVHGEFDDGVTEDELDALMMRVQFDV